MFGKAVQQHDVVPALKKDNEQIANNVHLESTAFNVEMPLPLAFHANLSLDLCAVLLDLEV